jgi:hypothetical protein
MRGNLTIQAMSGRKVGGSAQFNRARALDPLTA